MCSVCEQRISASCWYHGKQLENSISTVPRRVHGWSSSISWLHSINLVQTPISKSVKEPLTLDIERPLKAQKSDMWTANPLQIIQTAQMFWNLSSKGSWVQWQTSGQKFIDSTRNISFAIKAWSRRCILEHPVLRNSQVGWFGVKPTENKREAPRKTAIAPSSNFSRFNASSVQSNQWTQLPCASL